LTRQQTRHQLAAIGLTSNDEVDALFEWHNGTAFDPNLTLGDLWMFPFYYPLPLEEAIAYRADLTPFGCWNHYWLPVFADGSGDFMVVDLSEEGRGRVYSFDNEFPESPMEYESLSDMMATVAAAFAKGIFFVSETGQTPPESSTSYARPQTSLSLAYNGQCIYFIPLKGGKWR
jgi:hypothetical protein